LLRTYGVGWILGSAAVETIVLTAVAVIDLQHRLIPTLLVYPTIVFALACSALWPNLGLWHSLLGGGLAFALFFCLAGVARLLFGEGALGDGDVTLAALIGVICGYPAVVWSLALGALAGGLGALLLLLIRRSPLGSTIPYGPYLVIGVIYVLLSGNTMHPLYALG
jgi:leader peptidase (prepilin peptidase)/N-methyltransferase